jgi:hypothetical protein
MKEFIEWMNVILIFFVVECVTKFMLCISSWEISFSEAEMKDIKPSGSRK